MSSKIIKNSQRQSSKASPRRGSFLSSNFPSLFSDRHSSPPLITKTPSNFKNKLHVSSQFVRFNDQSAIGYSISQNQNTSQIAPHIQRESQFRQIRPYHNSTETFSKKSQSVVDLRTFSKPFHQEGIKESSDRTMTKTIGPNINNVTNLNKLRSRSISSTTNLTDNYKEKYSLGSILKKTKNSPDHSGQNYDIELPPTMQSKRRVIFKNKVSVFRFDSDGDSGCSSSEYDKHPTQQLQLHPRQQRPYRVSNPPTKISSNQLSVSLTNSLNRENTVILPYRSKVTSNSVQDTSIYLYIGDDPVDETPSIKVENKNLHSPILPPSFTNPATYLGVLQLPQQPGKESVFYNTPSGSFIINSSPKESDADSASSSARSLKSLKTKITSNLKDQAAFKTPNDLSSKTIDRTGLTKPPQNVKHPYKEATFRYHLVKDSNTLIVSVQLGVKLHHNDVLVKANKNGTKFRIVNNPDSKPLLELNEQIMLPIPVNPYKLSAKIDHSGNLLIEAPILKG